MRSSRSENVEMMTYLNVGMSFVNTVILCTILMVALS